MNTSELQHLIHDSPAEAIHELSAVFSDAGDFAEGAFIAKTDLDNLRDALQASFDKRSGAVIELKNERLTSRQMESYLCTLEGNCALLRDYHFSDDGYRTIFSCLDEAQGKLADLRNQSENSKDANRMMQEFRRSVPARKLKARREYRTDEGH